MMSRFRLVILNPTCLDVLDAHRGYLDQQGAKWLGEPWFRDLQPVQIDDVLRGAHALILPAAIRDLPWAEQMERYKDLCVLSIAASGYDWLDVAAATRCGIVVTHAPVSAGAEAVADLTFGLMLGVARQIPHHDAEVRRGRYDRGMGAGVWGKTLGIVGLGRIGRAVARRAAGFSMRVLAAEPDPDHTYLQEHEIALVPLKQLLAESDFVTLHVRLNRQTERMIGRREIDVMKQSAYLINTARANLVDEDALTAALLAGRIAGAGLDDPPAGARSPLLGLANVVFTPHIGNRAIEGVHAVFRCAVDNALAVLSGERPAFVVNPEVYRDAHHLRVAKKVTNR